MPDPKLDQALLDLRKTSQATESGAKESLSEQIQETEALKTLWESLNEEGRKKLAIDLELNETLKEQITHTKTIKNAYEQLHSVSKGIEIIQQKTGKTFSESAKSYVQLLQASGKQTKQVQALQVAADTLYKTNIKIMKTDQDSLKVLKDKQKTEKEIAKEREQQRQKELKAIKDTMQAVSKIAGSGLGGDIGGFMRAGTSFAGRPLHKRMPKAAAIGGPMVDMLIDALTLTKQLEMRESIFSQRLGVRSGFAGTAPKAGIMSLTAPGLLSMSEREKYGIGVMQLGIEATQKEVQEFAANSKLYGDDIAKNITEKMIVATGTTSESWTHINLLFNNLRDNANEAGLSIHQVATWTSDLSAKLRYLGVDNKLVVASMKTILDLKKKGLTYGIGLTQEKTPEALEGILGMRGRMSPALKLFYGSQMGLAGGPGSIFEQMTYGKNLQWSKTSPGTVTGFGANMANEVTLRSIEVAKKLIQQMPEESRGLGAEMLRQSGIINMTEDQLRLLLVTPMEDFQNTSSKEFQEFNNAGKTSAQHLGALELFENKKEAMMKGMSKIILGIFMILRHIDSVLKVGFRMGSAEDKRIVARVDKLHKTGWKEFEHALEGMADPILRGYGTEGGKKHIGGVIKRGTVSEVLTSESMKSLGRDSFYAFNPSHDIQIGSPQTTKNAMNRISGGMGTSDKKIEITLNVNGSILTDNTFLNKIEEVFVRRMGLIGG